MKSPDRVVYTKADSPVILHFPHSGRLDRVNGKPGKPVLPEMVRNNLMLDQPGVLDNLNMAVDEGALEMGRAWERSGQYSAVVQGVPRWALDTNHGKDQVDGGAVEGYGEPKWAHGAVWRATVETKGNPHRDILRRPYTREEYEALVAEVKMPEIQAVNDAVDRALAEFGKAVVVSMHTFPPNLPGKTREGRYTGGYNLGPVLPRGVTPMKEMPDVFLISGFDPSRGPLACSNEVRELALSTLRESGLLVIDGMGPFSGIDHGITEEVGMSRRQQGQNVHVIGAEVVAHNFHPGKIDGNLDSLDVAQLAVHQGAFDTLFDRLANM